MKKRACSPKSYSCFLHASECKDWILSASSLISGFRSWRADLRAQHWNGSGPGWMTENTTSYIIVIDRHVVM